MPNNRIDVHVSKRRGEIQVFHKDSDKLLFSIHQSENPAEYMKYHYFDEREIAKRIERDYSEEIESLSPSDDKPKCTCGDEEDRFEQDHGCCQACYFGLTS